jgi:hypothetical protein
MTDYMVSFTNGSGGNFLVSLLERTVLGDQVTYDPITLGKFNDAHDNAHNRNFKQERIIPKIPGDMREGFMSCTRVNPAQPVFMPLHLYWPSVQFEKYPNGRIAVILHTEEDALDISISGFFKTEMSTKDWRGPDGRRFAMALPPGSGGFNQNNMIFESIRQKPPNSLTPKELSIIVRSRVAMVLAAGYHLIEPLDDPRITYIQYRDLVTSPDRIMEFLRKTTGQEPNAQVLQDIRDYHNRQQDLISSVRSSLGL